MTHRSRKLRESARDAPHCMGCGRPNTGGTLVLAHSNALEDGRGAAHKSHDVLGAILCQDCHDLIDGRRGRLSKQEKREMHWRAHRRTLVWWVTQEILR
ncbi:MAG: nuclease domain-containing protein [Pseudomonadota bacterium]